MSFFNANALGMMAKAMFPSVVQKVQALEDDGTIDKMVSTFQTMARNGTAEQLVAFADNLAKFNEVMGRVVQLMEEANGYTAEPDADDGNARLVGLDRDGVSEPAGTH